jgi:hypothetical protein
MSSSRLKPSLTLGKCAFCGGSPLSGEHVWPEWSHRYFRRTAHDKRVEARITQSPKAVFAIPYERTQRHGMTITKRLRIASRDLRARKQNPI